MNEHTSDYWEQVLAGIDDHGFFGTPTGPRPIAVTACVASGVPRCRQWSRRRWARSPARVSTHPNGRRVPTSAERETSAPGWREVLGTDVTRVLLPVLAPVAIAALVPIVIVLVLTFA
jgi:hypothetical protein